MRGGAEGNFTTEDTEGTEEEKKGKGKRGKEGEGKEGEGKEGGGERKRGKKEGEVSCEFGCGGLVAMRSGAQAGVPVPHLEEGWKSEAGVSRLRGVGEWRMR